MLNRMQTVPTPTNPAEVFAELPDRKRADAEYLLELMSEISGEPPVVWGRKIIGFGSYSYKYASGHSGTAARIGFAAAPRQFSLYLTCDASEFEPFLDRLGPHKTGKGCIYITQLARVDRSVLKEMIEFAWKQPIPNEC